MGAATTALARCAWRVQKPHMGPLWRLAPRSAWPGPLLAHTVPVCSLGCHAACALCREMLVRQRAIMPIVQRLALAMFKRRAARARARRAAAAAGGATTGPKVRKGSWNPKIRSTAFTNAQEKYKQWRYNPLTSLAAQYLEDANTHTERSYAGTAFYGQFHMPRAVFDAVVYALAQHPPFADKKLGHNKVKWGTSSHPIRYKFAAAIYYLVDG